MLSSHITKLSQNSEIEGIAIGAAGSLTQDKLGFFNSPNLPDWNNKPLGKLIALEFDTNVFMENDTALVGLGEAVFGAGKGKSIVVYHTISTGFGGTRVVNGVLDEHALGFEPGHQIIMCPHVNKTSTAHPTDGDMLECPSCAIFGHLEGFVSGASLEQRYGKLPTDIKEKHVWDDVHMYLAYGLNNTLVYWSPNIVILGGGLVNHGLIKVKEIEKTLKNIVKIFPEIPPIVTSELGDLGGLYGGIAYLQNQLHITHKTE